MHKSPIDSDDSLFRKALQRFWKNQIPRFLAFLKADYPEIGSAFAFEDDYHTVFLNFGLKVAVVGWLLPQRVDLRLTAVFNNLRKTRRFDFEKLHCGCAQQRARRSRPIKKPARELRQEGSYYRCCIPALAGFVSPQSIAPDGGEISPHHRDAQLKNAALSLCRCVRVSVNASGLVRCDAHERSDDNPNTKSSGSEDFRY